MRFRTLIVAITIAVFAVACGWPRRGDTPIWPGQAWERATPADVGLNERPFENLHRSIVSGRFGFVDGLLVVREGRLVVERTYDRDYTNIVRGLKNNTFGCWDRPDCGSYREDYNYYDPRTHPFYRGRRVHELMSITKSVTSALTGMAIGRGEISGVGAALVSFLGDFDLSRIDSRLRTVTLEHLLTMQTGIAWNEMTAPPDETNNTSQLEASEDWVQFTIERPMDAAPGEKWVYNSGTAQVLSAVLRKATGTNVDEYAKEHLFAPIGIEEFHWKKTPTGLPDTEGGLYLKAEDLARIGLLYLRDGIWKHKRILPAGWVEASLRGKPFGDDPEGLGRTGYGYQWWRADRGSLQIWGAYGFGGNLLIIVPSLDLVGVVNAHNIFGHRHDAVQTAFIDAVLAAATP
jgi:CubicO group peptidase (beta-lactamase class C family)